jgi:RHS repeat-associated protein
VSWQPAATSGSTPHQVGYTWDQANNRTSADDGTATQTWTYDQRDRLTATTRTTGTTTQTTPITSNARGDVVGVGARTLAYDALDDLTGDGATGYGYDGLGRLATRTGQNLYYRGLGADPVGTASTSGLNQASTPTLGGAPTLSHNMGTGAVGVLLTDTHSDQVAQLDATGTIGGVVAYDPFGQRLAGSANPAATSYTGYQGDWTDTGTGTVLMGARWYDPALGTFLTRDTLTTALTDAGSTNRYTDANPTTDTDPTGHLAVALVISGIDEAFWDVVDPLLAWGDGVVAGIEAAGPEIAAGAAAVAAGAAAAEEGEAALDLVAPEVGIPAGLITGVVGALAAGTAAVLGYTAAQTPAAGTAGTTSTPAGQPTASGSTSAPPRSGTSTRTRQLVKTTVGTSTQPDAATRTVTGPTGCVPPPTPPGRTST